MKIAQIAPLFESVPPKLYGGTERVVSYLTDELVRQGHDVTLFASGDSRTKARLIAPCERALRLGTRSLDRLSPHVLLIEWVLREAQNFDIIHSHLDFLPFPSFRRLDQPTVTTLHGRLDLPELRPLMEEFSELPVISISNAQRGPFPAACWQGTVYHGLPSQLLPFRPTPGNYLAFLGRISAEKRVDRAIEIARRAGMKLRVAAKVDTGDEEYFRTVASELLQNPQVEFLGEIDEKEKAEFLAGAAALLFPIDWPEPFGIVMIEAMACGTPVIAYPCGSVPEIVKPGVTGFIVQSIEEAVEAVRRTPALSRAAIRNHFEKYFTAERMANDYLRIYDKLLRRSTASDRAGAALISRFGDFPILKES
jgi:glycosyltransferase involved in cell wall biosynthesis